MALPAAKNYHRKLYRIRDAPKFFQKPFMMSENLHFESPKDIAHFKALQEPKLGGWLQVIPSNILGTAMNGHDFRICIVLRLGNHFFTKHNCICGSMVDESLSRWSKLR